MGDFVDTNLDLEDRGEAKYFHGQKRILGSFQRRVKWTENDPRKGITFLIQIAPDAARVRCSASLSVLPSDWKLLSGRPK